MWEMRIAYKILVENLKNRDLLGDLNIEENIILQWA
jgi:hypothetical protein